MLILKPFKGGAAVPHHKGTADKVIETMPLPARVVIPMLQHIGALCEPLVQKGDRVLVGQIIGNSDKALATPIHSSVSGTVKEVAPSLYPGGFFVPSVEIETDGKQEPAPGLLPPTWEGKEAFLRVVRNSGLSGLGGAGFPVYVKLTIPADKPVDTLVVNAAECEPYITSDYRVMLERTQLVVHGIKTVRDEIGFAKVLVGVEANKPEAARRLKAALAGDPRVQVTTLPVRYPQGAEKMLIAALTGRRVPTGKLPADVGVVVMNVNSLASLADYILTGMPLVKKVVTVDGPAVREPKNVEVLIGTPLKDVFAFAGGFAKEPKKIIMGGPMMGVAQHSLETSVVKHTNSLLAFDDSLASEDKAGACIRCGRCVKTCPMNLLPLEIAKSALLGRTEDLKIFDVNSCIECGSCSFVCPSKIQLVQLMRLGKTRLRAAALKKGAH